MRQEIIRRALDERAAGAADAVAIADATVLVVRLLHVELEALVGGQAAQALYMRAVHLTRPLFGWSAVSAGAHAELLSALHADLVSLSPADARQAAEAVLLSFADLLISLIGESLTHRLLRSAWGASQHGNDKTFEEKRNE